MVYSVKMFFAKLFWRYTFAGIPYIVFVGMILFLSSFPILDLLPLNIGVPMAILAIVLMLTPAFFVNEKDNLPRYVVERISKLLVDKTDTPPEDATEKSYISALKNLLPTYVSSKDESDFEDLKKVLDRYEKFQELTFKYTKVKSKRDDMTANLMKIGNERKKLENKSSV